MMKKILFLAILLIASLTTFAQSLKWANKMGGTSNDEGRSIALDASGNVFTTGYFNGTVDFDPGPGTFNLTSTGSEDVFISKLDVAGNFVWAKQISGTSNDIGQSIAVDASGIASRWNWSLWHRMVPRICWNNKSTIVFSRFLYNDSHGL